MEIGRAEKLYECTPGGCVLLRVDWNRFHDTTVRSEGGRSTPPQTQKDSREQGTGVPKRHITTQVKINFTSDKPSCEFCDIEGCVLV